MARVNGLKALFNSNQVKNVIDQFQKKFDEKALLTLQYAGETFVNNARLLNSYTDRTGNLRSSIGYIIIKDGNIINESFQIATKGNDKYTGLEKGKNFAINIASKYPKGFILIGVAGMEYAAAVEANGYDVITGSDPSGLIKSIFSEVKL